MERQTMGQENTGVKRMLEEVARLDRRLEALMERQRRYRAMESALDRPSAGLEALARETAERVEAYAALVRRVEARIDALEDPMQREVLRYRYLNGWRWQTIAARTGFSREWLWRVHARALAALGAAEEGERGGMEC